MLPGSILDGAGLKRSLCYLLEVLCISLLYLHLHTVGSMSTLGYVVHKSKVVYKNFTVAISFC
jgi:hypothetical protein